MVPLGNDSGTLNSTTPERSRIPSGSSGPPWSGSKSAQWPAVRNRPLEIIQDVQPPKKRRPTRPSVDATRLSAPQSDSVSAPSCGSPATTLSTVKKTTASTGLPWSSISTSSPLKIAEPFSQCIMLRLSRILISPVVHGFDGEMPSPSEIGFAEVKTQPDGARNPDHLAIDIRPIAVQVEIRARVQPDVFDMKRHRRKLITALVGNLVRDGPFSTGSSTLSVAGKYGARHQERHRGSRGWCRVFIINSDSLQGDQREHEPTPGIQPGHGLAQDRPLGLPVIRHLSARARALPRSSTDRRLATGAKSASTQT